jgi:ribonuclease P protein component
VRLVYDRVAPGWDLVFVVRSPDAATVEFTQLQTTIEQMLRRAGVWREPNATSG